MRRSLTIAAPVLTGLLVLGLGFAYPASSVRGSGLTGPKPPQSIAVPPLGPQYRVRWTRRDADPVLRIRDGAACRPRIQRVTSTGPARIEVVVDRPAGPTCRTAPRWWSFRLPPPAVRAPSQQLFVLVNGRGTGVPAPRR